MGKGKGFVIGAVIGAVIGIAIIVYSILTAMPGSGEGLPGPINTIAGWFWVTCLTLGDSTSACRLALPVILGLIVGLIGYAVSPRT